MNLILIWSAFICVAFAARNVVIVGTDPSALLSAIFFAGREGWTVTVIEKSTFQTFLSPKTTSLPTGLSALGQRALERVPGLLNYVKHVAVKTEVHDIYVAGRVFSKPIQNMVINPDDLSVQLYNFLLTMNKRKRNVRVLFDTEVVRIDGTKKNINIVEGRREKRLSYDLLVGSDGPRSVVRNFLFSQNSQFTCSQTSAFKTIKTILVDKPEGFREDINFIAPTALKNAFFGLYGAPNGKLIIAVAKANDKAVDDALLSSDGDVVAEYINSRIGNVFELSNEQGQLLANAEWYEPMKVVCSPYHLVRESAVIIGDAAHSSSPVLGRSLDVSLEDSAVLDSLMDMFSEELNLVLPQYSSERVKEGHALTELSSNFDAGVMWTLPINLFRRLAHQLTFGWVEKPFMDRVTEGLQMSDLYQLANSQETYHFSRFLRSQALKQDSLEDSGLVSPSDHRAREQLNEIRQLQTPPYSAVV